MNHLNLIKTGESDTVEFKEKFDERTIESAVAFANTKSGIIFIGVSDKNKIMGITIGNETLNKWTNQISQSTDPRIIPELESMKVDGKNVVAVKIKENPIKPISTKGKCLKRVDSSNMENVRYTPDETKQTELFNNTDNIKDDRTPEDLLFQVLLDWGVNLSLPITKENIADLEVFFVDGNALAACFVNNGQITEDFCKELAKREPLRVVFRDSGFSDDSVKINVEQIFKLMSPHTDVMTL